MKTTLLRRLVLVSSLTAASFAAWAGEDATFRIFLDECGVTDEAVRSNALATAGAQGLFAYNPTANRPYVEWKKKFVDAVAGAGRTCIRTSARPAPSTDTETSSIRTSARPAPSTDTEASCIRTSARPAPSEAEIADAFVRVYPDTWTFSRGTDPDQAVQKAVKWFLLNGPKMDKRKDSRDLHFGAGLLVRAGERYNRPEWIKAGCALVDDKNPKGPSKWLLNRSDFALENRVRERIPHYLRGQLVSYDGTLDGAFIDEDAGAGRTCVRTSARPAPRIPEGISPYMTAFVAITLMKCAAPAASDVEVFKSGTAIDGRVCKIFRIPAITTAPNGDLVAVCDARWTSHVDLWEGGDISFAVSRSSDHGRTWSKPVLTWKFPGAAGRNMRLSDPSLVTDAVTKEIFLIGNAQDPTQKTALRRVFVQKSSDNGKTWSEPVEITAAWRDADWKEDEIVYVTSGRGIQMKDGTLAVCQYHDSKGRGRLVGTRDHGKTWCVLSGWYGGEAAGAGRTCIRNSVRPAPSGAGESKVVELADGRLLVMSREGFLKKGAPVGHKLLFVSDDRGKTWSCEDAGAGRTCIRNSVRPAPSAMNAAALVSPACNGALLRMKDRDGRDALVASVPYARTRQNVSVLVSYDEGRTWGEATALWTGPSAYSELVDLGNGLVGILYERGVESYHEAIAFRVLDIAGPKPLAETADILWRGAVCKENGGKGYAGWPSLAQLRNGDLMAVWSGDRQHHVDPYGKIRMAKSTDGGRTWSAPRTIADTPIDDRDCGVVELPDGEILVSWFTSVAYRSIKKYADADKLTEAERAKWYGILAVRSRDGGATWSAPEHLGVPGSAPHGPILLKDGSLLYVGRSITDAAAERNAEKTGRTKVFAAKSTDGGHTWQVLCEEFPDENGENAPAHQFHEPSVVELANGKLVAYVRYHNKNRAFRRSESTDGGRTWSPLHDTGICGGETAPHLLRLNDGRVLLTYGNRDRNEPLGLGEIATVCETAEGQPIVGEKFMLLPPHTPHLGDHGYPATIQRPDGTLYTLCYQADKLNEPPCILGCGWRLPAEERFVFVKDGVLQTEIVCSTNEPLALAKSEILRVLDAVTGCGTNTGTYLGASRTENGTHPGTYLGASRTENRLELTVDPTLGEGDVYSISFDDAGAGRTCVRTSARPAPSTGTDSTCVRTSARPAPSRLLIRGSNERSVVAGAMTLLNRLGCRWFWPSEQGEYLPPPAKDLSVAVFSETSRAAFPYRQLSSHPFKLKAWYYCHNRMNPFTGSDKSRYRVYWGQTSAWGGHSFGWIYPEGIKSREEYFQKFPEQFALWNGKRIISQHCYTSPETIKTFQDWILRFWPAHPDIDILNLSAVDTPYHCTCPECAKKDSSTLYFDFINAITEPARKAFPAKRYSTIAYSFYLAPPKTQLKPDVMMSYCMYNRCYCHPFTDETCPINGRALKGMRGWREVLGHAPEIYGYHFDVWGGPLAYPAPFAPVLQEEAQRARDAGVRFWFTEYNGVLEYMNAMRFEAYAFARLSWNPDLDFAALRRDWCQRMYGPAAKPMEAYMAAIENAWQLCGQHVGGYNNPPSKFVDKFVSDEVLKFVDEQFAAAEAALARSDDARAAREVAYDKEVWGRWRELKLSRGNWSALAAKPDPDRLAWFAKCPAGDVVYPREGVKSDWKDLDYVPEFYTNSNKQVLCKSDSLLFGNHPGCFGDQGWINYEVSYRFSFPTEKSQQTLYFRCGGQRFEGQTFGHYRLGIDRRKIALERYDGHGRQFENPTLVTIKRPFTDNDWHTVVVRCYDTHAIITIDGEKLIDRDIRLGGGYVNLCGHGQKLNIRDFTVRLLDDPTKEDLRRMKDPNYKPKTFIDGTGKVMNL